MARPLVLGNGTILVGLDQFGCVRDFFYPYVGMENHACGDQHRIGIWTDHTFSWLSDDAWQRTLRYDHESLVTNIHARNDQQQIELSLNDAVDHEHPLFIRHITIQNNAPYRRTIKLFMHQVFTIFESAYGDTVYYNPFLNALVHYKGKRYFVINGAHHTSTTSGIAEFAAGLAGKFGKEGTWRDAEDGSLSDNTIEHGSVDSTIGFTVTLDPSEKKRISYWIGAGKKLADITAINTYALKHHDTIIAQTKKHWQTWVNRTPLRFEGLNNDIVRLFKQSLLIIRSHTDKHGAIIASSDSTTLHKQRDSYSYMWPRDGALITGALDRSGYIDISQRFFTFCKDAITDDGYLLHKYLPNGALGSSWHSWLDEGHIQLPIQEDETASVLDALWKHYTIYEDNDFIKTLYKPFIKKAGNFLATYIDEQTGLPQESYDLWEEKLGIHTYTCCTVYAGLYAAANFEDRFGDPATANEYRAQARRIKQNILDYLYDTERGYFIKRIYYERGKRYYDTTLDASSAYGIIACNVLPSSDERVKSSFAMLKKNLQCHGCKVGGYARYMRDQYYQVDTSLPGNPWFITTLWIAEYYIAIAGTKEDLDPAIAILDWTCNYALSTGVLSEQINPHTGDQLSVAPLAWSHAAFVTTIIKYLEKLDDLGLCDMCQPVIPKERQ
jgi:oligosaccharide amylase